MDGYADTDEVRGERVGLAWGNGESGEATRQVANGVANSPPLLLLAGVCPRIQEAIEPTPRDRRVSDP